MLRNLLRRSPSSKLISGTPNIGLIASQIISETATGDQGPGLLYDEAQAHTGQQLRVKVTSWSGTVGALAVYENGSVLIEGQADGTYTIGYDWEAWAANGTLTTGSDTASVQIGPQGATAPGATVTGVGTVSTGAASGEVNASASGASVIGTGAVSGGSATGEQNATASGATVTGTASVSTGGASGGVAGDATASGATVTGYGSVSGGVASGVQNSIASGAIVYGYGIVIAGSASNDTYQNAPDGSGPAIVRAKSYRPANVQTSIRH